MATAYEDLYTAIKAMMVDVNAAVTQTVTQAPSNYGTDFRIPNGQVMYQAQISPAEDWRRSTVIYPRASVSLAIMHRRTALATEEIFLHQVMSDVADRFLDTTIWTAESGVYGLDPDEPPEVGEGSREGNVLVFEVAAVVIMDPA